MLRDASRADIPAMHRVRMSVRENRLRTRKITEADYVPVMEANGRGWVIEENGEVVGFAVGDKRDGNIWALFVHPDHERRGYGRRLHDAMVAWLRSQGLEQLWLTTEPGTRAQAFYEAAGWRHAGRTDQGELRLELRGPAMAMEVTLRSVITCPECGAKSEEEMPTNACVFFYECKGCHKLLRPLKGDCCVFCSFGSVKCPPVQMKGGCCD